ncbi:MAG: glycosyltransferase family 4 protein [Dehalococcoidia bacterium]|nr:glycosyltransferase family 4 protein [Dehalococcoidia bacterium]
MNIGMVLTNAGYPPDVRLEKEARSLVAAGYEVHLLCPFGKERQRASEDVREIHVHRIQVPDPVTRVRQKVSYYLKGVDENWLRAIMLFAKEQGIEALHVHDLAHAVTAEAAGKALGIPVVFDMHGDGVAATEIHRAANPVPFRPVLALKRALLASVLGNDIKWLRRMEKRALQQADHVIVVVDESKERLVKLGTPESKVTVVMNCEETDNFLSIPMNSDVVKTYAGRFVISYVGGMEAVRGLDILIDSFPMVAARIPNATLLLVGDGYMRARLEEQAQKLGLQDKVVFTGWVDFSLVPTYISLSKVCMVPHTSNALTDTTISHKLFQYMLMGKPVAALPVRPTQRILEETGAGIVARDESPEALAEAILQAAEPEQARLMGERGKRAATDKYSWANEGVKLVRVYERLAKHSHGEPTPSPAPAP